MPPVLPIFIGAVLVALPVAVIGLVVAWDVYLARRRPDGTWTISWRMALMGKWPMAVFALGAWVGFLACLGLVALPLHFWFGMPPPEMWDDYQRLLALEQLGRLNPCP